MISAIVADGRVTADDARPVPWWSFGKTVLAAAALQLVAAGALSLDQQVADEAFTLRQLLSHRAGLSDYGLLPEYHAAVARGDAPWSEAEMLARLPPPHSPDARFGYSNVGYLHVRRLIERASGSDLGTVFAPFGISGVRIVASAADLADTAWGNAQNYDPGWVYHGLLAGPAGSAALFLDRLLTGALLPPSLLAEMRTALPLTLPDDGRPWRDGGYGLGLMIGTGEPAVLFEGHTGGGPGSRICVVHCPSAGRTACVAAPIEDEAIVECAAMAVAATGRAGADDAGSV